MNHDWTGYCVRHVEEARASAGTRRTFRRLLGTGWEAFAQVNNLPVTDPPDTRPGVTFVPTTVRRPTNGPGSKLKMLLAQLGARGVGCVPCDDYAAQMDLWGVAGVQARREEIKAWLKLNQTWGGTFTAIARGAMTGLLFKLNPLDPLGSLIDEACRLSGEESCATDTPAASTGSGGSPPA